MIFFGKIKYYKKLIFYLWLINDNIYTKKEENLIIESKNKNKIEKEENKQQTNDNLRIINNYELNIILINLKNKINLCYKS